MIYSLLLTSVFVGGLYLFRATSVSNAYVDYGDNTGVYILSEQEWVDSFTIGDTVIQGNRVTRLGEVENYYTAKSFEYLPVIIVFLCLFLVISSFVLWRILRHIHEKEAARLTEKLQGVEDGSLSSFDPVMKESIERIRQKLLDYFDDYKRLNSYLSHEQKNAISILRANMEIKGDRDAIKILDRISDSMDDILTLSDNTEPSIKASVDVALVCAAACDSYRNFSKNIIFNFDEDDNTVILAKERWIYRAVSNLLDNAMKYGDGKPVEVTVQNKNRSVLLSIRDHGIGIPKDKYERIFLNRYRVNELNRDGYGIGLSLVSHVCDLCGGFVLVESKENEGSCFYLSFPEYGG